MLSFRAPHTNEEKKKEEFKPDRSGKIAQQNTLPGFAKNKVNHLQNSNLKFHLFQLISKSFN